MNSLEKLIEVDGYQPFVSVDTVLRVLLAPPPGLVRLDQGVDKWTQEDLCSTVADAESKLTRLHEPSRPVFFFAQPQNVHALTLGQISKVRPPQKSYPGFHPLLASELERADACFGDFMRYLKAQDLYADSIVVLTADHGESLGESGHKGHALELTPQVLRIPLIVHLPTAMRDKYVYDPQQIAFTTDIVPSLYYLLGHRPIVKDERFGRPMFTMTLEEQAEYARKSYLVISSYGPIYGILSSNGTGLFVANAVTGENQFFNLARDPGGTHSVPTTRSSQETRASCAVTCRASRISIISVIASRLCWNG
jgi:arylsulfatase A-like enzyme